MCFTVVEGFTVVKSFTVVEGFVKMFRISITETTGSTKKAILLV
jgi:hypothetical protein